MPSDIIVLWLKLELDIRRESAVHHLAPHDILSPLIDTRGLGVVADHVVAHEIIG